jgi:hypothetical protein
MEGNTLMLVQLFFEKAKGVLYRATELASGNVDGKAFSVHANDDGLIIRGQEVGTQIIPWSELAKSITEAARVDGDGWTPMEQASTSTNRATGEVVSPQEAGADEVWGNNLYTVHVRRGERMVHLSIHRHDRAPARDWRHFQRIKNEIVGPEYEAVEIYPNEARLVDTSNQYHLWVILDEFGGAEELGIGFHDGRVTAVPDDLKEAYPGAVQRPFEATP